MNKPTEKDYPQWICSECGDNYGRRECGLATFHLNTCDVCGFEEMVTEPREYGHLKDGWQHEKSGSKKEDYVALPLFGVHVPDASEPMDELGGDKRVNDITERVYRNQTSKVDVEPLHEKAARYIKENPHIYRMFCHFAWEAINAGRQTLSASMITERIRWETMLSGNDQFKVSNNYRAYMARQFMDDNPQHSGIFRTRQTKQEKGQEL